MKKKKKNINQVDLVTNKVIYIDGKRIGGVLACNIKMEIAKNPSLLTKVQLTLAIKKGSLHIEDIPERYGVQKVSFSTTNDAFEMDNLDFAEWVAHKKGLVK